MTSSNLSLEELEDSIWSETVIATVTPYVQSIERQMEPQIQLVLERIDALVAGGELITDQDLEGVVAGLNDSLADALMLEMEQLQAPVRELAARQGEVVQPAPMLTGSTLMREASMDKTPMAEWFQRRSPSKWMSGVMNALRKEIDAGWERQRVAAEASVKRLVGIAAETGLFSSANQNLLRNLTGQELVLVVTIDEQTCEICKPLQGTLVDSSVLAPPLHPQCRCTVKPRRATQST